MSIFATYGVRNVKSSRSKNMYETKFHKCFCATVRTGLSTRFKSLIIFVGRFVCFSFAKKKRTYAMQRLYFYTRTLSRANNHNYQPIKIFPSLSKSTLGNPFVRISANCSLVPVLFNPIDSSFTLKRNQWYLIA